MKHILLAAASLLISAAPAAAQNLSTFIGPDGRPQYVDPTHGMPTADLGGASYAGSTALVVGTAATAGRAVLINCTVAGNVAMTLSDASIITVSLPIGVFVLPFAATKINTAGTTATATYWNLP
jgi:hypothetical protein